MMKPPNKGHLQITDKSSCPKLVRYVVYSLVINLDNYKGGSLYNRSINSFVKMKIHTDDFRSYRLHFLRKEKMGSLKASKVGGTYYLVHLERRNK